MMRILLALALVCGSVLPVRAQGTTMPMPLITWLDNAGGVFSDGGLCVFVAGTSTLSTTYTTAALSVPNANPIEFDSAGRPTSGGVFLTPGVSYKFVLKNFAGVVSPTCIPDTGVTIWTVDNVSAVPGSASAVDVTGTAGVTIAAGQAAYMSDGSGGLTGGQWYLADADLVYAGALPLVGIAPSAVTSGATGTFRIAGVVTASGSVTPGLDYYVSSTPGVLTPTPPPYARFVARADTATTLVVAANPRSTPISPRGPPCGRLTLTSGTPVTSANVTAATTVYYTPYAGCNTISLYDGTSAWVQRTFTEVSIAVPATTATMYDVFAYDNAGTLTLELTAWTNDTTRATALATQNGVYVKTGALTRLYLGSFRTTGVSGQTEDSATKRYLWNYYHRVRRALLRRESTASWTYSSASFQQANASAANQVEVVVGVNEVLVRLTVSALPNPSAATNAAVGIGLDSTTTPASGQVGGAVTLGTASTFYPVSASIEMAPGIGRHFFAWLEGGVTAGTVTWYSANVVATGILMGLVGSYEG